jgi:flagellar hook-length control protein FliK
MSLVAGTACPEPPRSSAAAPRGRPTRRPAWPRHLPPHRPPAAASLAAGTPAFGATGPGAAIQGGVIPGAAGPGATGPSTAASASPGTGNGLTPATPDALAASVIAMCRNGQPSLLLRLDPPGLGALSVHVAMGSNADVNVLFVPTVAQTAHLLHGGLGDLRQAMAASGLTLGQAQIGSGGGSNSTGGGGTDRDQARNPATAAASPFVAPPQPENAARGARAVA